VKVAETIQAIARERGQVQPLAASRDEQLGQLAGPLDQADEQRMLERRQRTPGGWTPGEQGLELVADLGDAVARRWTIRRRRSNCTFHGAAPSDPFSKLRDTLQLFARELTRSNEPSIGNSPSKKQEGS
jgi:hypothetical protein